MSQAVRSDRFCDNGLVELTDDIQRKLKVLLKFDEYIEQVTLEQVLDNQKTEMAECEAYRVGWEKAKKIYEERRGQPDKFPALTDNNPKEYHLALICYSLNDFYSNQTTRDICTEEDYERFPYRSFFYMLLQACKHISPGGLSEHQKLYTGRDIKMGALKDGEVIFQQFLSTTKNKEVAKKFAGSGEGTVIEIRNIRLDYMCTNMGQHSLYPEEEEVLVWPFEVFKSIEQCSFYTKGPCIVLEA